MNIPNDYLERFKVNIPQTLFPPIWENLEVNRCPLCGNKMRVTRNGKITLCTSKKHGKPFLMKIK